MLAAALALGTAPAAADRFEATFSEGIPEGFTLRNLDGMGFNSAHFASKVQPQNEWYSEMAGEDFGKGEIRCAVSNSHRDNPEVATDNWLISPAIKVDEGASLHWAAKSFNYYTPEDYTVMISTSGTATDAFKPLAEIFNENYLWTDHFADLSEYAGKEVHIAFVHCSKHKFLLGINGFEVGVPDEVILRGSNAGMHYFGAKDDAKVTVDLKNFGAAADVIRLTVTKADGSAAWSNTDAFKLLPGEGKIVEIPIDDATVGTAFKYNVTATLSDGSKHELFTDCLNKSEFRRKMLVEKYTYKSCNNCPIVLKPAHTALLIMGDEAIYVEPHSTGGYGYDDLGLDAYIGNMPYSVKGDFPSLWFNRTKQVSSIKPFELEPLYDAMLVPTLADVKMESALDDDGNIIAEITVIPAEDIDNSKGNLRIGVTLAEKEIIPEDDAPTQQNRNPNIGAYYGEPHYMASVINNALMKYENVVRGPANGGSGAEGSLPMTTLKKGQEYVYDFFMEVPDNMLSKDGILIATLVDTGTKSYNVLNADSNEIEVIPSEPGEPSEPVIPIGEVTLNMKSAIVDAGKTVQLVARINPDHASITLEWTSSDETVATVDRYGLVTGVGKGEADITVTSSQGEKASCHISVIDTGVEGVSDSAIAAERLADGGVRINLNDTIFYQAYVTTADGKLIASKQNYGNECTISGSLLNGVSGVVIITVNTAEGSKAFKMVL